MTSSPGKEHTPLRILVIQPDPLCSMERFTEWMRTGGNTFTIVEPSLGHDIPETLEGFDALIVLGGEMGDGDDDQYPWLEDIRQLLRSTNANAQPTLGVCLGAQLMAAALGGKVAVGEAGLETGLVEVEKTGAAATDPLLGNLPETFLAGAMHQDAIVAIPESATLLATGSMYPHQAFRQGMSWGVQFHPELSPELYRTWMTETGPHSPRTQQLFDEGLADFIARDSLVIDANAKLAQNFIDLVRQTSSESEIQPR